MTKESTAVANAVATTMFVTVVAVASFGAAFYLLATGAAQILTALAYISPTWIAEHRTAIPIAAGVLTVPPTVGTVIWMFRHALAGERALERAPPPAGDGPAGADAA